MILVEVRPKRHPDSYGANPYFRINDQEFRTRIPGAGAPGGKHGSMRWFLVLLLTLSSAQAQDWLVLVPAPQEMVSSGSLLVESLVLRGGAHPLVRPLLYVEETPGVEGPSTREMAARLTPTGKVVTTIPEGAKLERFESEGGWTLVYWENGPSFRATTSPHVPGTLASVTAPEGLPESAVNRLKNLPTRPGRSLGLVLLPRRIPTGYQGQTATSEDRAVVQYRCGESFFQLDYQVRTPNAPTTEGREDFDLYHHALGRWTMLRERSGNWVSPWLDLPGRKTKGQIRDGGQLRLTFSSDHTPEQIRFVVTELRRLH